MSRSTLYTARLELCLTPGQLKQVKELARINNKRMNEIIRQAINEMWEKV